jgi:hypothetical protein
MQSGALQQLGVSYPQLFDYSSKEYTATLVGPTHDLQMYYSTQTNVGSSLHPVNNSMGLYHHLVCTFSPFELMLLMLHTRSEGELAFFWRAERRSRWSVARVLFILVSSPICWVNHAHLKFPRTAVSR